MIFFSICAVFAVLALLAIAKELNKTREALEVTQTSLEDIAQTLDYSIAKELSKTHETLEEALENITQTPYPDTKDIWIPARESNE